jgi:predicted SnoaL-like aldol condensation-catalyzing enzyme
MWNNRDLSLMRELMAPGAVGHLEGGRQTIGPDGFAEFQADFVAAVPDIKIEVKNCLADGDDACVHWRATNGEGMGMTPSEAPLDFQGVTWLRVKDGQIVEGWDFWNFDSLIRKMACA